MTASRVRVIIGGSLEDYYGLSSEFLYLHSWLVRLHRKNKLQSVNNGQWCIKGVVDCIVPGGLNFCGTDKESFNILAANVQTTSSNEKSIVMKVTDRVTGWSMLLSGDIEGRASEIISEKLGVHLQLYVYKMAYHGHIKGQP